MKFMQRAAAAQSPAAPVSDPVESRPAKKARLGNGLNKDEEARFIIDQKAAQAALQNEDRQRQAAIDRMAERMGDSHWVLDTAKLPSPHKQAGTPLKIVQVGFSEIDKRGEAEEGQEKPVRAFQSYGPKEEAQKGKKKKAEKAGRSPAAQTSYGADIHLQTSTDSDSDSSDSDSESDSDSNSFDSGSSSEEADEVPQKKPGRTSYGSQKRDELKRKRSAEQAKSIGMASNRRKKQVNLQRLTSISGGGSAPKEPGARH